MLNPGYRGVHFFRVAERDVYKRQSSGGETPAPAPTPSGDTYTVQTGDSLSAIGAKLGLDWREIAALRCV